MTGLKEWLDYAVSLIPAERKAYGRRVVRDIFPDLDLHWNERTLASIRDARSAGAVGGRYLFSEAKQIAMEQIYAKRPQAAIAIITEFVGADAAESFAAAWQSEYDAVSDLNVDDSIWRLVLSLQQLNSPLASEVINGADAADVRVMVSQAQKPKRYPCSMAVPLEDWEEQARENERPQLQVLQFMRSTNHEHLAVALCNIANWYSVLSFGFRFSAGVWQTKALPHFAQAIDLFKAKEQLDDLKFALFDAALCALQVKKSNLARNYLEQLIAVGAQEGRHASPAFNFVVLSNYSVALHASMNLQRAREMATQAADARRRCTQAELDVVDARKIILP